MKRIIPVFILVLCFGFVSQCEWGNDDDDTCADCCWLEITNVECDEINCNEDNVATVYCMLHCNGKDHCDGYLSHYRVSFFRTDSSENCLGTFDIYSDFFDYIQCGEQTSLLIKILHADQFQDCWGVFDGYADIQFWGKFTDDSELYTETQIPIHFDHSMQGY